MAKIAFAQNQFCEFTAGIRSHMSTEEGYNPETPNFDFTHTSYSGSPHFRTQIAPCSD